MRPPEPDFVTSYKTWKAAGPPKCCHTCDHFGGRGECMVFDMTPPAEFAATVDQCDKWEEELPF